MKQKYIDEFWIWLKLILLAGFLAFIIKGFIFIPTPVVGNSMKPTLNPNDQVLMERFSKIKRFDVVVVNMPNGATYIKRVIGLPGDEISYHNDQLYVNGKQVPEPFLKQKKANQNTTTAYTNDFELQEIIGRKTLPENNYFLLGDNRRLSKDSRTFGAVQEKNIIGKARFIYYPLQDFGKIK